MRLHMVLDGLVPSSQAPSEWLISRVCEEFKCTPSVARRELENDRNGDIFMIMKMRMYSHYKALWDGAQGEGMDKRREELLANEMVHEIITNEFELIQMKQRGEL